VEKETGRFVVTGGHRLCGSVRISGAKNAILPVLAAALLSSGESVLRDAPVIRDVAIMVGILRHLGVRVEAEPAATGEGQTLILDGSSLSQYEVGADFTREMRSSIFLMGPLLARCGQVRMSYPGGCAIGPRPIDLHLRGLELLGARIQERFGYIEATASRLRGSEVYLDFPSVGATENLMMAAVLADGLTVIRNAAREPEIVDLQNFLNRMGARVRGAGMDVIRIEGVGRLESVEHTVIPDRIEASTCMAAAAVTGGDVLLRNLIPEHLEAVTAKLREMGTEIQEEQDALRVVARGRLRGTDLKTLPYPGFPTDMQPQMMALMAVAEGTSIVTETIFENRYKVADELRRMGAHIKTEGRTAVVQGVNRLSGANVQAPALREGTALVLAGLVAEDVTTIEQIYHIDRGYSRLEKKLGALGARIERL
jgi:UDP-N-acetylglucosamine 1-carboxyvinyltransferase